MKVSVLPLCFFATVLAQQQKQVKPNQNSIIKNKIQNQQQQQVPEKRKLRNDYKLRGYASSSTISSSSSQHEDKNLTAVIHIGPMKTGSSAIQLSLGTVYKTLKDIDQYEDAGFAMDNGIEAYHMIGCFRPDAVPYTGRKDIFEISCHPNALEQVTKIANERNHNLIITAEYLTDPKTNLIQFKEFLKPWKNIKIVAYYRRYYEWLLSFHNQIYKQHETPITRKSIPDFIQNEKSFHFFYENMYITNAVERYQAGGFDNIQIINMYDLPQHDVRESFYCSGLVNATASCNQFHEHLKIETSASENPSTPLIYNELAYYAKEMKLWSDVTENSLNMKSVAKLAQENYNSKKRNLKSYDFHDNAFICPTSDVYDWLLQTSLSIEKELFPKYYTAQGEKEIIADFKLLINAKKFCHINAQYVLQNDKEWQKFFRNLSLKSQ